MNKTKTAILALCVAFEFSALAKTVFVANPGANNVSVIDAALNTVIDTVPVGVRPIHVEASPDGKLVYVSNQGSDTVSVIDVASHAVVATIAVGDAPVGIAASPDNLKVYVTHDSGAAIDFVWVIDVATFTASLAFSLPNQTDTDGPTATFHPNGSEIWIKNGCGDGCTRRVAYPSHVVLGDLPTETAGANAAENHISFVPGTQILYAAHSCGCCGHFDRSQYAPSITYTGRRYETGQGGACWTVAAPTGGIVYLARNTGCSGLSTVIRKESAVTDSTLHSVTIPGINTSVGAITPDGARLYFTTSGPSSESSGVTVVDTATMSVVATIHTGYQPFGIAILQETSTGNDTEAPSITCPAGISLPCNTDRLVVVTYPPAVVSDNSDPSPTVTYSIPSGSGFPVGTTTVAVNATDASGNHNSCSFTVTRAPLSFAGFLSPVGGADATGGSFASPLGTFKFKSTIPLKFKLSCEGSVVTTGVHTLEAIKWSSSTTSDAAIDATPTDAATTGNQFRLSGDEWHFNLDTKSTGMSVGIWQLIATLSDGSQHSVWIQLK